MKILVASEYFYPAFGGAEISLLNIIKGIKDSNEIHIAYNDTLGEKPCNTFSNSIVDVKINNPLIRGYWVRRCIENHIWKYHIKKIISKVKPDLLITQLEYSAPSIIAAYEFGIPTVLFIRSFEYFCLIGYPKETCDFNCPNCFEDWKDNIQYLFSKNLYKMKVGAFKKATKIIANSNYMAGMCQKIHNRKVDVIYPFGWEDAIIDRKNKTKGEYITMVTPVIPKGVEIFIEIAIRLSKYKFLAVGRTDKYIRQKLDKIKNIEYLEWTNDKREIYAKTSIMLVPSLWEEPFGRVCIEAISNEIPCIASEKGGIAEAVMGGGILINNPFDIDKWVEEIEKVMRNNELRKKLIEKGKKHIAMFDRETSIKKMKGIINKLYVKSPDFSRAI